MDVESWEQPDDDGTFGRELENVEAACSCH